MRPWAKESSTPPNAWCTQRNTKKTRNGILCNARSDISLEKAINKFLNLPKNKRQKMGINGRKFVENEFNEKKVLNTYFKIINNDQ